MHLTVKCWVRTGTSSPGGTIPKSRGGTLYPAWFYSSLKGRTKGDGALGGGGQLTAALASGRAIDMLPGETNRTQQRGRVPYGAGRFLGDSHAGALSLSFPLVPREVNKGFRGNTSPLEGARRANPGKGNKAFRRIRRCPGEAAVPL